MVETLNPPVNTSRPFKVLVAELVCSMLPPEIASPDAEESPPIVSIDIPPANVEVAVEEEFKPPPACRSFATERVFPNVEEAFAEMFCASNVEEACNGEPAIMRPEEKVEEAVETRPPEESTEKRVVVAPAPWRSLWTRRGEPV